ncbi:MAG: hypothetical protein ACXWC8_16420 [Limisphaerales bacterium]
MELNRRTRKNYQPQLIQSMNETTNIPMWKKIMKWAVGALLAVIVIDWLVDGRLRDRLPGRNKKGAQ